MDANSENLSSGNWQSDRLNNLVVISVAVLSGFMAITKVKDDNIVQTMQQAKSEVIDTWAEYQAKKIKHHLDDMSVIQLKLLQERGGQTMQGQSEIARLGEEVERYKGEEKALETKAKEDDGFRRPARVGLPPGLARESIILSA